LLPIHRARLSGGPLTNRELQVLAYQAACLPRTSISRELGISPRRLQRHISTITRKLTPGDRRDAARDTSDTPLDDSRWPFW
jgi:DNA-binding NarL/FixJ family response regulator